MFFVILHTLLTLIFTYCLYKSTVAKQLTLRILRFIQFKIIFHSKVKGNVQEYRDKACLLKKVML